MLRYEGNDPTGTTFQKRSMDPEIPTHEPKVFLNKRPISPGFLKAKDLSTPNVFGQEFDFTLQFWVIQAKEGASIPRPYTESVQIFVPRGQKGVKRTNESGLHARPNRKASW